MSTESETQEVVRGYFSGWTEKRTSDAFALLAPNLTFVGPNASYRTAAEFRPALDGFAAMTRGARVISLVVEGSRAALLYDCDLPEPVGTLRIASFFWVEAGKISRYETFFDPTELRNLVPRKP